MMEAASKGSKEDVLAAQFVPDGPVVYGMERLQPSALALDPPSFMELNDALERVRLISLDLGDAGNAYSAADAKLLPAQQLAWRIAAAALPNQTVATLRQSLPSVVPTASKPLLNYVRGSFTKPGELEVARVLHHVAVQDHVFRSSGALPEVLDAPQLVLLRIVNAEVYFHSMAVEMAGALPKRALESDLDESYQLARRRFHEFLTAALRPKEWCAWRNVILIPVISGLVDRRLVAGSPKLLNDAKRDPVVDALLKQFDAQRSLVPPDVVMKAACKAETALNERLKAAIANRTLPSAHVPLLAQIAKDQTESMAPWVHSMLAEVVSEERTEQSTLRPWDQRLLGEIMQDWKAVQRDVSPPPRQCPVPELVHEIMNDLAKDAASRPPVLHPQVRALLTDIAAEEISRRDVLAGDSPTGKLLQEVMADAAEPPQLPPKRELDVGATAILQDILKEEAAPRKPIEVSAKEEDYGAIRATLRSIMSEKAITTKNEAVARKLDDRHTKLLRDIQREFAAAPAPAAAQPKAEMGPEIHAVLHDIFIDEAQPSPAPALGTRHLKLLQEILSEPHVPPRTPPTINEQHLELLRKILSDFSAEQKSTAKAAMQPKGLTLLTEIAAEAATPPQQATAPVQFQPMTLAILDDIFAEAANPPSRPLAARAVLDTQQVKLLQTIISESAVGRKQAPDAILPSPETGAVLGDISADVAKGPQPITLQPLTMAILNDIFAEERNAQHEHGLTTEAHSAILRDIAVEEAAMRRARPPSRGGVGHKMLSVNDVKLLREIAGEQIASVNGIGVRKPVIAAEVKEWARIMAKNVPPKSSIESPPLPTPAPARAAIPRPLPTTPEGVLSFILNDATNAEAGESETALEVDSSERELAAVAQITPMTEGRPPVRSRTAVPLAPPPQTQVAESANQETLPTNRELTAQARELVEQIIADVPAPQTVPAKAEESPDADRQLTAQARGLVEQIMADSATTTRTTPSTTTTVRTERRAPELPSSLLSDLVDAAAAERSSEVPARSPSQRVPSQSRREARRPPRASATATPAMGESDVTASVSVPGSGSRVPIFRDEKEAAAHGVEFV